MKPDVTEATLPCEGRCAPQTTPHRFAFARGGYLWFTCAGCGERRIWGCQELEHHGPNGVAA